MAEGYLKDLIRLLPKGAPRPSKDHQIRIHMIDGAVQGYIEDLRARIALCEKDLLEITPIGKFANEYSIYADVPERNRANMAEHERRIRHLKRVLPEAKIEDGKLKSAQRIKSKVQRLKAQGEDTPYICDFSRARIVSSNLEELEKTHSTLSRKLELEYLGGINRYGENKPKYQPGYRAVATYWIMPEGPSFMTEIQLVTENVRSIMDVNHAFDVTKKCEYPSTDHATWVSSLFYKASILDIEERLKK